jgi:hypothetical protein
VVCSEIGERTGEERIWVLTDMEFAKISFLLDHLGLVCFLVLFWGTEV